MDYKIIGNALYKAVSSGKITVEEYKKAVEGIKIIKKVL